MNASEFHKERSRVEPVERGRKEKISGRAKKKANKKNQKNSFSSLFYDVFFFSLCIVFNSNYKNSFLDTAPWCHSGDARLFIEIFYKLIFSRTIVRCWRWWWWKQRNIKWNAINPNFSLIKIHRPLRRHPARSPSKTCCTGRPIQNHRQTSSCRS